MPILIKDRVTYNHEDNSFDLKIVERDQKVVDLNFCFYDKKLFFIKLKW